MEDTGFWKDVSYVEMAANRSAVLRCLVQAGRPMTPTEIADRIDVVMNSASRAVRQLADRGMVDCVNPDAARDRRYRATTHGRRVWDMIDQDPVETVAVFGHDAPAYDIPDDIEPGPDTAYVRMSENRRTALQLLATADRPLTATAVSEAVDIPLNSASRALRQLEDQGLAECVTPEASRYRRYTVTKRGAAVWGRLSEG